jgi:hypothetical protein
MIGRVIRINEELEKIRRYYNDIHELEELEDGWNGKGSKGYSKEQTREALIFVTELKSLFKKHNIGFVYPDIFPGHRKLTLEWFFPENFNLDLMIDICHESNMNLVQIYADTFESSYHEDTTRNNISDVLFDWLKKNMPVEFFDWLNETMKKEENEQQQFFKC